MIIKKIVRKNLKLIGALLFIGVVSFTGCQTTNKVVAQKSGAQLWSQKCQSCHNAPPPNAFSPQQWDVIIDHMRVKANLTNQEADKIVAFLKQQ